MRLAASMVVRNERSRYLDVALDSLLGFVDLIVILDDASDDGTSEHLAARAADDERIVVERNRTAGFFAHEGRTRQRLLQVTLQHAPTHVLAIDADELVDDGRAVRASVEADEGRGSWSLVMEEVWKADPAFLWTRQDGGWRAHAVPVLWRVPGKRELRTAAWTIPQRQLACGREPSAVRRIRPAVVTGAAILHFGWTRESERRARAQRYQVADGGRFHASAHLDSILWPDRRVRLMRRRWPAGLDRGVLLGRVGA